MTSFIFVLLSKYYYDDQIKEAKMGRTYSTHVGEEMDTKSWEGGDLEGNK
jgi:hypothetical protein